MIDLKQYGYSETVPPPEGLIPGRVTEQCREQYTVITEHGTKTLPNGASKLRKVEVTENEPI